MICIFTYFLCLQRNCQKKANVFIGSFDFKRTLNNLVDLWRQFRIEVFTWLCNQRGKRNASKAVLNDLTKCLSRREPRLHILTSVSWVVDHCVWWSLSFPMYAFWNMKCLQCYIKTSCQEKWYILSWASIHILVVSLYRSFLLLYFYSVTFICNNQSTQFYDFCYW